MKLLALLLAIALVIAQPSIGLVALHMTVGLVAWTLAQPAVLAIALAAVLAHLATREHRARNRRARHSYGYAAVN